MVSTLEFVTFVFSFCIDSRKLDFSEIQICMTLQGQICFRIIDMDIYPTAFVFVALTLKGDLAFFVPHRHCHLGEFDLGRSRLALSTQSCSPWKFMSHIELHTTLFAYIQKRDWRRTHRRLSFGWKCDAVGDIQHSRGNPSNSFKVSRRPRDVNVRMICEHF